MVDALERVTGSIQYVMSLEVPGMCHCALHGSDRAHALIRSIDVAAAMAVPGVLAVITRDDFGSTARVSPHFGPVVKDQPLVALEKVRYIGEPVVAVAAATLAAAREAASLIEVDYEDLPAVFDVQRALAPDAPLVHDLDGQLVDTFVTVVPVRGLAGNVCNRFSLRHGDIQSGFAQADLVFEDVVRSPAVAHVAMEPHVALAIPDAGRLVVWSSTQTPHAVRHELATMFHLPQTHVQVKVPSVGGGYGSKVYTKLEPIVAALALKAGRPVKLALTRQEDFHVLTKHEARIELRTGVTSDGVLVARQVRALYNAGAYADISPRLITNSGASTPGPYRIPHVDVESIAVYTNLPPAGAFRGFGVTQAAWAYEVQMDLIAKRLGIDPIEMRRRNLLREGDQYATGETLHDFHLGRVLDDAVQALGFQEPLAQPPDPLRRRGRGAAVIMKATVTPTTSTAWVRMDRDGSVSVLTSTVEMGQGSRTVLSQIVAADLRVALEHVRIVDPDTDVTPFDQTTTSSRSTYSMGNALLRATGEIRRQLIELGAAVLEADVADVELEDGQVRHKRLPELGISYGALMTRTLAGSLLGSGSFITSGGLDPQTGQGIASVHWHQGAGAAEVEVDCVTGKVSVLRYHSSVYAGRVVNPLTARLQVQGSAIFGLGQTLFEEMVFDDGRLLNANLSDYPVPAFGDLPSALTATLLEGEADSEIHGIGETALPPVMPAVANAVADAIGVHLVEAPLTPERVLGALERASTAAEATRG
jgi:CO/xanthine dehydrogenase Mo-binding subunit